MEMCITIKKGSWPHEIKVVINLTGDPMLIDKIYQLIKDFAKEEDFEIE